MKAKTERNEKKKNHSVRPDLAVYLSNPSCDGLDTYAYARQTGTLSAGLKTTGVAFDYFDASDAGDFEIDAEFITVNRPGTYLITCMITVPRTASVDTVFRLMTENRPLAGASVRVCHTPGTDDASCMTQTVIRINERTTLTLTPDQNVDYAANDEESTLASLTVLKLRD